MRFAHLVSTLIGAAACLATHAAADVTEYAGGRIISYRQMSNAAPTTPEAWNLIAVVVSGAQSEILAGSVSFDRPPTVTLPMTEATVVLWQCGSAIYSDEATFLAEYPATTYTFEVDRGAGPETGDLYLPEDLYCEAIPAFTGDTWARLQTIDPVQAFVGTINGFSLNPGTTTGSISIIVVADSGPSPGPVWSAALDPSETTFEIPAGTLSPDTHYSIGLSYLNELRVPGAGFGNAESLAEYTRATAAYFNTIPAPTCDPVWAPATLSNRTYHASAFDPVRARVLVFGGYDETYTSDTWQWDGAQWSQVATAGPSVRGFAAMATDAARDRVVLHGGNTTTGDTWEWDGTRWSLVADGGPGPRVNHAMAYDAVAGHTLLFGGTVDSPGGTIVYGDTWAWNGATWTQLATTGPSARSTHAMAYDPVRNRTVLFGGSEGSNYLDDTWEWDGAAWTQIPVTGPVGRLWSRMAWDPVSQRVILFGGHDPGSPSDTWAYDGTSWTLLPASGPPGRYAHTLCLDEARNRLVLFGGTVGLSYLRDTWEFDGTTWTDVTPASPGYRAGASMCWDGTRVILFGGAVFPTPAATGSSASGETWGWDGSAWSLLASSGPIARAYATMCYDSDRGVVVMYEPIGSNTRTWEWDGAAWNLASTVGPSGLDKGLLAYDSHRHRSVYVSYRVGAGANSRETWEWDGVSWLLRSTGQPAANVDAALCYDAARQVCVLHVGGVTSTWDGTAWTVVSSSGPSSRFSHDMVYDPDRQRVVLYAGQFGGGAPPEMDTWEWDGASWTQAEYGPLAYALYGSAWDDANHRMVIQGGYMPGSRVSNMTWTYSGSPAVLVDPTPVLAAPGDTVAFSVAAQGRGSLTYQWRQNGADLTDGTTPGGSVIAGATTAVLTITNAGPDDAGAYDAVVSNGCAQDISAAATLTLGAPPCDPDYNLDGNTDQDDVAYLINVIGGGDNPTGRDPDFTGDGNADQDDVTALINTIAGGPCP